MASEMEREKKGEVDIPPCFNAVVVQRKSEGTISYFPYLMIALQEMNLSVEEPLLYRLSALAMNLSTEAESQLLLRCPITEEDR